MLFYCASDQTLEQVTRKSCGVSILEDSQNQLDTVLSNHPYLTLLEQRLD